MAGSIIIHGHSLMAPELHEKHEPGNTARCSCGAWCRLLAMPSATGRVKARRNWHDEHKRDVWRRLHPEDFQEDRPMYSDMEPNQ